MPIICQFLGIIIRMYTNDHNPPHFHAEYGEFEGVFNMIDLEMIAGNLPKRVRLYVVE